MFYLIPTRNMFAGKFVEWVRFSAVLQVAVAVYIFYNVEWVKVRRMGDVF